MINDINFTIFHQTLTAIKKQHTDERKYMEAMNLAFDGHPIYVLSDGIINAAIKLVQHFTNDKYDYIPWWLYETTDYTVYDNDIKYNLNTTRKLYNYLIKGS